MSEQVTITSEAGLVADARSVAQPVNVIDRRRNSRRATEVVAQVVDEEPGVNLQRTAPSLSAVFVRGLTGRNVGVYVDGVRYTTSAQRGGVGTFFSLIEPSSLETVEILRGPNSSQYGSDVLGRRRQLHFARARLRRQRRRMARQHQCLLFVGDQRLWRQSTCDLRHTKFRLSAQRERATRSTGCVPATASTSHSALTRFLGIPFRLVRRVRLPDTAFTQYGGLLRTNFNFDDQRPNCSSVMRATNRTAASATISLLGGDGNLIADLRNLMTDLFYARLSKQNLGFFDNASFTFSYNSQREERVNQGGQGNPLGAITYQRERTNVLGFNFYLDKQLGERNTFLFGADVYRDNIHAHGRSLRSGHARVTPSRPRIPDGARYLSYGFFAQDVFTAIPERLRISGALALQRRVLQIARGECAGRSADARCFPMTARASALFQVASARWYARRRL